MPHFLPYLILALHLHVFLHNLKSQLSRGASSSVVPLAEGIQRKSSMADVKLGVMNEDPDNCVLTFLALMTPEPK